MKIDSCLSHNSDDWKTPTWLYETMMKKQYIDCFKYKSETDETKNYYYGKKLFINPPFSKMNDICQWICNQIENKCTVALLIPARTDTIYFHKLMYYKPLIIFIKGRLKYNDSKAAPFPTILLIFRPNPLNLTVYQYMTQEELKNWLEE